MNVYRKIVKMAIAMAAILSLIVGQASAATFTVARLSDGPNAATTKGTLRWAITQAELDPLADTIRFNTQGTIALSSPLPWIDTPITINGPGIVISGDNTHPIFGVGQNSDASSFGNLTLSRLTVAKGAYETGGAVYCEGGSVTATNCVFRGNSAVAGGAIYLENFDSVAGSLDLTGCTFTGNTAFAAGGAVAAVAGEFSATDCTFNQNSCVAPPGFEGEFGGGALVYLAPAPDNPFVSSPALVHCTFTGNLAFSDSGSVVGGAVAGSWVDATRCTFRNNLAISTYEKALSEGGAIFAISGVLVTDCAFARNRAGDPAADPGTFPSAGGAIAAFTGYTIQNGGYPVTAVNCSFGANSAYDGSAVSTGALYMANSIVWGNPAGDGPQLSVAYFAQVEYSDIQIPNGEVFPGPGNINANPRWVLNAQQGDQDNSGGVLQLLDGSPCIDAGSNFDATLVGLTVDLVGRNRFINDPDTPDTGEGSPPIVDMGAYEFRQ